MSEAEVTPRFKKGAAVDTDPDAFMTKAKEALEAQRTEVEERLKTVQDELDAIDAKLARIDNYFNPAATREPPAKARAPRKATGPRGPRDTGVRDRILAKIKEYPDGVKAIDLIKALGGDEDKKIATQVRNTVKPLQEDGKIVVVSKGVYKAV